MINQAPIVSAEMPMSISIRNSATKATMIANRSMRNAAARSPRLARSTGSRTPSGVAMLRRAAGSTAPSMAVMRWLVAVAIVGSPHAAGPDIIADPDHEGGAGNGEARIGFKNELAPKAFEHARKD